LCENKLLKGRERSVSMERNWLEKRNYSRLLQLAVPGEEFGEKSAG